MLISMFLLAVLAAGCQSDEAEQPVIAATSPPPTATEKPKPTETPTATPIPTAEPIATPQPIPVSEDEGWELVWHDEFDGEVIDRSNWNFDIGGWGWGNGEGQYYTDRPVNARVENGLLVIEARQEKYEEKYYTSARLLTQGLQAFQYGRIEARIKVPEGAGLWPAFWMLGDDFNRDPIDPIISNWPNAGEIDIMEYLGREPDLIMGTAHGPGYAGAGGLGRWNRQEYLIADAFHTYAVEWNYEGISWFYDGEHYFTLAREDVGEREWVFDKEFFILLNLAVGGQWPGPVGLDTKFPANVYVDYVRVYQESS